MREIGTITIDGQQVGVITLSLSGLNAEEDSFTPDLKGYEPEGRAAEPPIGDIPHHPSEPEKSPGQHPHESGGHSTGGHEEIHAPEPHHYAPSTHGRPVAQGSAEVNAAIVAAAKAHHLDPDFMKAVASIESGMHPNSNAGRATQYKGLYQMGSRGQHSEWARFGQGNIYSAKQNAMAAARMFEANRNLFKHHFGREPTETEMYMMHQQGLGFYTRGTMTNIRGNPYPGMHGPQTHASFEAGWGRELERRKESFAKADAKQEHASSAGTGPI